MMPTTYDTWKLTHLTEASYLRQQEALERADAPREARERIDEWPATGEKTPVRTWLCAGCGAELPYLEHRCSICRALLCEVCADCASCLACLETPHAA
jgi:hypothetical protein